VPSSRSVDNGFSAASAGRCLPRAGVKPASGALAAGRSDVRTAAQTVNNG